ncbi:TolC family protein [Algibacter mikhailovii]|uniref:Transporter n=1 Tax=Algibacter mikhailovii TaxID=425498 RepID=A0A918QYQ6_9FLAO|nr:TolC family protein [Algibacter mikhailovii]GGZ74736.1 transporter [Algibacter mikhailovii]
MKIKLILGFSLLFVLKGFTQETEETKSRFTLQEAIEYAIVHNRNAKNASRDVEAAYKQKWETIAIGLPQLNGQVDYQNNIKQQVNVIPSDFEDPDSPLVPVVFGAKQNLSASASLSQLIFDGSYIVGLQSAKVFLEISKNAKEKTDLEVRKGTIDAYGNVLLSEETVSILKENRATLQKNLDEITKIFENGLEEEESVEQLKITLADIESALNRSERVKSVSLQMLNMTMGLDINHPTILLDNLETLTARNVDLGLISDPYSVEENIDYKIAENDKTSKELLIKLAKSDAMPSISAFVNGGYNSFGDSFTFFDKGQDYFGFAVFGVGMSIPIFSSGQRSAATQRAKIDFAKAEDDLIETEQRIKLDIATAQSDYQYSIEDYSNKKENLNLSERIEAKNQTKFFEGIASSFDLRQAQIQLYTAQQEFLQAMLDVITKKATLETLLNRINP